jgi:hypothetical protein
MEEHQLPYRNTNTSPTAFNEMAIISEMESMLENCKETEEETALPIFRPLKIVATIPTMV